MARAGDRRSTCRRSVVDRIVAPELGPGASHAGQADRPGAGVEQEPWTGGPAVLLGGEDQLLVHGSQYAEGV